MNPLKEMERYISDKMDSLTAIPDHDKALLSSHVFIVAATSPKDYKACVDRFLERMPAGTEYTHDLQELHASISEWIEPREKMPRTPARGRGGKSVALSISISDKVQKQMVGRYSYFVELMLAQGIEYPAREDVARFVQEWIYARIDEAIEGPQEKEIEKDKATASIVRGGMESASIASTPVLKRETRRDDVGSTVKPQILSSSRSTLAYCYHPARGFFYYCCSCKPHDREVREVPARDLTKHATCLTCGRVINPH